MCRQSILRPFNNYVDKMSGEGIKKKGQNCVHLVVECKFVHLVVQEPNCTWPISCNGFSSQNHERKKNDFVKNNL